MDGASPNTHTTALRLLHTWLHTNHFLHLRRRPLRHTRQPPLRPPLTFCINIHLLPMDFPTAWQQGADDTIAAGAACLPTARTLELCSRKKVTAGIPSRPRTPLPHSNRNRPLTATRLEERVPNMQRPQASSAWPARRSIPTQ